MITSSSNPQIKNIKQLQKKKKVRDEQGLFVCEGKKMMEEARKLGCLEKAYASENFCLQLEQAGISMDQYFAGIAYEIVADGLFQEISETITPQGILAVVQKPNYSLEHMIQSRNNRLLILEDIQDPGNLGTMLRTAEGAGLEGVLMSKGTVDLFNPKVIRSTMGSIYRVPYYYVENLEEILNQLRANGMVLYAAHLEGSKEYHKVDYADCYGILIGNEANGLSERITKCTDIRIKIPMAGQVESLNAAVSAALIMYEANKLG